jgi:ABC-type transport system involved in multi-copper enzyme maturation permease subunit
MAGRRVVLVAWHVFKESVRDRVLYGIGAFALLLVAASLLIGQITAGEDVKIIKDLGLATIELAGVLMTVFIGVGLVSREIDRRSIFALLAKPLARWEFIAGKYVGLVLTVAVNVAGMTAALFLMLTWMSWGELAQVRKALEAPIVDPALLVAALLIFAELGLLTAVALFFSTFSSSALVSVVLTLGAYVAGHLSRDLRGFGDIVDVPAVVAVGVATIGYLVPAFSEFDVKHEVVHGIPLAASQIVYALTYAAIYAGAVIGASMLVFSRREFK